MMPSDHGMNDLQQFCMFVFHKDSVGSQISAGSGQTEEAGSEALEPDKRSEVIQCLIYQTPCDDIVGRLDQIPFSGVLGPL